MKTEIDYIYALCLKGGDPFYVGRTIDLKRRMGEHRRNSAAGHTETKYQVIRDIVAGGDEWDHFVLAEVTTVDQHYEQFWVYSLLCEGYALANMKAGDSEKAAERDAMNSMAERKERFNDAKTFLDAREREIKEAAARAATARLQAKEAKAEKADRFIDWDRTLFAGEKPELKFISPAKRAADARNAAAKEAKILREKAAEWRSISNGF